MGKLYYIWGNLLVSLSAIFYSGKRVEYADNERAKSFLLTVCFYYKIPWKQLYTEDTQNIIEYTQDITIFLAYKQVIGLATYTMSNLVSFCKFAQGQLTRLLQSEFNSEQQWEQKEYRESDILENPPLEIGSSEVVSYLIN